MPKNSIEKMGKFDTPTTVSDLKKYAGQLRRIEEPTDEQTAFRYQKFSPLFSNLYENKIIYSERQTYCIAKVKNLSITPKGFEATANFYLTLRDGYILLGNKRIKRWIFSGFWGQMYLTENNSLKPISYGSCWEIWLDPELVKQVEHLTLNKIDEMMTLLYPTR